MELGANAGAGKKMVYSPHIRKDCGFFIVW
jgi:hypothetical protein